MLKLRLLLRGPYLLIAAGLLGFALWWVLLRPQPRDEQRLAALVGQVASGVERHRLRAIMSALSRDYQDSRGYTYREIWRQAARYVASAPPTRVRISNFQPEVAGDLAIATMWVWVHSVGGAGEVVTYEGPVSAHFHREGLAGWKITNTEGWQATVEPYQ